jgi:cell division septum initiation protein DivIVA
MDRGIKMEKTKDLKNKKLVRRLIQLSQPKKDISKTFKVEDEKKYHLDTEEVDELGLDEVIDELEQWLEEKESKEEKVEVDDKDENVMDFLNKIDFDYLVKLK